MLGALISGGASLISGLFGMSSAKKRDRENARRQAESDARNEARVDAMNKDVRARAERAAAVPIITTSKSTGSVDIAAMMAGAEKAGFNPVTWLRNGGMQAYAINNNVQTTENSQLMDAALAGSTLFQGSPPTPSTAPGIGEVIGNALTTGASQWVREAEQDRQNNFQMQLLNAQLTGAQTRGAGGSRSFYTPTAYLTGTNVKTARNSAVLGGKSLLEDLYVPYRDNSATGGGRTVWLPNPKIADSEQGVMAGWGTGGLSVADEAKRQKSAWSDVGSWIAGKAMDVGRKASAISNYLGGPWGSPVPRANYGRRYDPTKSAFQ